jgi:hypothetical protein
MSKPKQRRAERTSGGPFLGPDVLIPVSLRTLSDEYHDEPAEPEDSDRVPVPEPPTLVRRVLDKLSRSSDGG